MDVVSASGTGRCSGGTLADESYARVRLSLAACVLDAS